MPLARAQEDTAARLRQAATEIFYERGYHGTSMPDIASAVGIQAGSVYNHFSSKEDILFAIARGTMEEMLEGGRAVVASSEAPERQLRRLIEFHVC